MLVLVLVVTKLLVGLLLSSALAFGFYVVSIPIITSFWPSSVINGLMLTVITTSIGASIGGFLAWYERDRKLTFQFLIFAVIFACASTGAYLGLLHGIELLPGQLDWKYGLPVLSVAIRGAVISANVPPLVLAVSKGVRAFRL